ncbi:putative endopeptidase [Singulisphaera sp. GP187]|uniref:M13 family metallopeptidase n=1 Tax=Singulisphaera sp. GP187 TaxID=1882752 RepID=UPI0009260783|nr:M13 family metallopeptidase [Singulisphaera sp. GP187]SIO60553.1 putative endopeptidase [Singulisphaera sp. GP187]
MRRLTWAALALASIATPLPLPLNAADATKSGIDKSFVDKSARPQDDLYRHVNGVWLDTAKIPADRPQDGAFYKLRDQAEADLRVLIEAAAKGEGEQTPEAKKVGDLFASFMDEEAVNSLGATPIAEDLAKVKAIADKPGLVKALAEFGKAGVTGLFSAGVNTDAKQSDRYIIYLGQSGIGLPDESYYRDPKFQEKRDAYVLHIARMLKLAGLPDPDGSAKTIMALETRLAKSHWDRVKSRDDTLTYNKKDRKGLVELTPGFDWPSFFDGIGAKGVEEVVVAQPDYFTAFAKGLDEVPLADWKTWLAWHVVRHYAPMLGQPFVDESFDFYGKTLTGTTENRPRWKRGVAAVEGMLGEAIGKIYVAKHFPPAAKARMKQLVANLIEAYRRNFESLDWMGPETKKKALEKLAKFTPKIGYPDEWRDYSNLEIRHDDLIGNVRRSAAFETARELAKLAKPVDRNEWFMTPQTVNAYYNPGMNEIVFPAAILRPPFFDMDADDAVNYGGIGAVIGHEVGHGFDDQGSKYDGDGNLNDWWTDADRAEFDKRAKLLIEQYNAFEPAQLPGQHVNGALTIGENIGDLGGLTIASKAYRIALDGKPSPTLDGLTGSQRLFVGWAQVWRSKTRDAELIRRLAVDPHSPTEFRCNGVIRNMPEFYEAFGVKEGDKLYLPPDRRVRIW